MKAHFETLDFFWWVSAAAIAALTIAADPTFNHFSIFRSWLAGGGGLSEIQLFQYFTTFFPEMHNDIDF